MFKYLPIIKTAQCGSLNKAAKELGYTQPSLWYIINNMESEFGIKIFSRTKRGVSLTNVGKELLDIMAKIQSLEEQLYKTAQIRQENRLPVGATLSVASQWMPDIMLKLSERYPNTTVKLEYHINYIEGIASMDNYNIDCCFSVIDDPKGLDCIKLYEDPYYLITNEDHPLASRKSISVDEVLERYPMIPNNESFDTDSPMHKYYKSAANVTMAEFDPMDNQITISLVERGLGVTILPYLGLNIYLRDHRVKAIPLENGLHRNINLICPNEQDRSQLITDFIDITVAYVNEWRKKQTYENI